MDKEPNCTVHVQAPNPTDARVALEKWSRLEERIHSPRFYLDIVNKEAMWGQKDSENFTSEEWNRLWRTVAEDNLLPLEYKDTTA